jgi:hypothetical protein
MNLPVKISRWGFKFPEGLAPASGQGRKDGGNTMRKTLAKAGTGAALLIATALVALALGAPAAGALENKNDAWAVIFATETEGNTGQIAEGWALHNWLVGHGWLDSHIKFLAEHGSADAAPTKENLQGAISNVAQASNSNSLVFIAVMDDGQNVNGDISFFASNGQVGTGLFAGWVNGITTCKKMVLDVNFRFSGGFIQGLGGANRVIISSHASTQACMPNHFSLAEGLGASPIVQEAFYHQANKISTQYSGTQTPQTYDGAGMVNLAVS